MQGYCPHVVEKTVSPLPAPGAALSRCAAAREVKHSMTSSPAESVFPQLNTRGSTHIGAPGLFVLSLGSLVLLTGFVPPEPAGGPTRNNRKRQPRLRRESKMP